MADGSEYSILFDRYRCHLCLIDGDPTTEVQLNRYGSRSNSFEVHNIVLGDGQERTWYECKQRSTSSVLPPNNEICGYFSGLREAVEIASASKAKTYRLDDVLQNQSFDLIKSDVQGFDLRVLSNGLAVLSRALVVEIEVEFIEQYKGQPRFSEVELFMRKHGFMFHRFTQYGTRPFAGSLKIHTSDVGSFHQWLWANAIFIRPPEFWRRWNRESLLRSAIILFDVYQSYDLVALLLELYDQKSGDNSVARFADSIRQ